MATYAELTGLQVCLTNTDAYIDKALDTGDRRAFRMWCKRRAALCTRIQRLLVQAVTAS